MPYIKEAIASVRAQEYRHFQHFIVDDGSSDGTTDYLKNNNNKDLVVMHEPPIGRGKALNLGTEHCRSEFVAILDADDVASPCWLATMVKIMEQKSDIAVLSCNGILEKEKIAMRVNGEVSAYRLAPRMFLYRNPVTHSGTLIRMQVLRESGGYDESRDCLFDYELWVRLMNQGKQIWRIDSGLIFKRIHAGQHFERRNRLHYLSGSYQIRRSVSVRLLNGRGAMIPALLFLYGLLPRGFRHWIYSRKNREKSL
jgi:glycosyltransferase involved in cell wall biosynthesis